MYSRRCDSRARARLEALRGVRHGCRARSTHGCLIILIDLTSASEMLALDPSTLEHAAREREVPHYLIAEHIQFDPVELDRWIRGQWIDEGR